MIYGQGRVRQRAIAARRNQARNTALSVSLTQYGVQLDVYAKQIGLAMTVASIRAYAMPLASTQPELMLTAAALAHRTAQYA